MIAVAAAAGAFQKIFSPDRQQTIEAHGASPKPSVRGIWHAMIRRRLAGYAAPLYGASSGERVIDHRNDNGSHHRDEHAVEIEPTHALGAE